MSQHLGELIAAWQGTDPITMAMLIVMGVAFAALVAVGLFSSWMKLVESHDPDWNREGNIHR